MQSMWVVQYCGVCADRWGTFGELQSVWIRHNLVNHIRQLPELAAALDKGVMVADVGCG